MLNTIHEALADVAAGKLLIVVDDEDRENEGDLFQATQFVTPESVNFMATHGRGMICVSIMDDRADQLQLAPMVAHNTSLRGTGFTVSIDYVHGTTTGISAFDRAKTLRAVVEPHTKPEDFARPGHIHPLRARPGGVLERAGQTEAAVDLARLAGCFPSGILCEIMGDDGQMMRRPALRKFADLHGIKIVSVADLIRYRSIHERTVVERVRVHFPTNYGEFTLFHFEAVCEHKDHLAIVKGNLPLRQPALVRVHSECLTGDVLGSQRCDCGGQLHAALRAIENEGSGAVIYLRQEGRGIGLGPKLQAYKLQDEGFDTVDANLHLGFRADQRTYGAASQILRQLGATRVRLMTNNPKKVEELEQLGIQVTERVSIQVNTSAASKSYMQTKRDKMGHIIIMDE